MPIAEVLFSSIGLSVAKALFSAWLKDEIVDATVEAGATGLSDAVFKLAEKKTGSFFTAQKAKGQVNEVAVTVAENLKPLIDAETQLDEGEKEAVIHSVGRTIAGVKAKDLFSSDLKPSKLAEYFLHSNARAKQDLNPRAEALFDRIINEVAALLVGIANKLPGFEVEAFKKVINNQNQLLDLLLEVLNVLRDVNRASPDSDQRSRDFEVQYRNEVIANLNQMDHLGLQQISDTVKKCPLDVAYVNLMVRGPSAHQSELSPSDTLLQLAGRVNRMKEYKTEDLLASIKYLLIRGQAGGGKTTLLRWLAVQMAKNHLADSLPDWHNCLPFYVRLRDYAGKPLPNPEDFIYFAAANIMGNMPQGWAHRVLESGRGVILIDGVDELPIKQRGEVKKKIASWQKTFDKTKIIVTSRPSAVGEGWLNEEEFVHAEVTPLDRQSVPEFIRSWHEAVKAIVLEEKEKAELDGLAESITRRILESPALMDVAQTPLLLSAICAINRDRNRVVPENRVDVYDELVKMLLERRDRERDIKDPLDANTKRTVLQRLAYWMVTEDKASAATDLVRDQIAKRLPLGVSIDVDEAYRVLVERSGILREPVVGEVDFIHLTIQEYLAAAEAVFNYELKPLLNNAGNDRWERVIQFASGIANKTAAKYQEELIRGLYSQGRYWLALESLRSGVGPNTAEIAKQCLQSAITELIHENQVDIVAAFKEAGLPFLGLDVNRGGWHLGLRISVLAQIGTQEAYNVLLSYKGCNKPGVLRALLAISLADSQSPFFFRNIVEDFIGPLELDEVQLVKPRTLEMLKLLPTIRALDIQNSGDVDLSVLAHLHYLQSLKLNRLREVHDLNVLAQLPNLQHLSLYNLPKVQSLSVLAQLPSLCNLEVVNVNATLDIGFLAQRPSLQSLKLDDLNNVLDLNILTRLSNLQTLILYGLGEVQNLDALSRLPNLKNIELFNLDGITDLSTLTQLPNLQSIGLNLSNTHQDLSFLAQLPNLRNLRLNLSNTHQDLSFLAQLPNLQSLALSRLEELRDLSALARMPNLRTLWLYDLYRIHDLSVLAQLSNLQSLGLDKLSKMQDLSFLAQLPNLQSLWLLDLLETHDLSVLAQHSNLRNLSLHPVNERYNLGFLANLPLLETLGFPF